MKKLTLAKDKIHVSLLEGVHKEAVDYFQSQGYTNIEYVDHALENDELVDLLKTTHILGIRSRTQVTKELLAKAPKLFSIGCFCIGTNQVALNDSKLRGIPVFNAPFSNTRSVAELVIAETIMLMRGIAAKNARAHRGVWTKTAKNAHEIRGKVMGIVGYGHIGSQVSVMAESLGMKIQYYDIENKLRIGNASPVSSLDKLLKTSDIVTLHVPATKLTHHMIGEKQLKIMRKGACLINAARGTVVDLDALSEALDSGRVFGAALDVFPEEPATSDEPFTCELQEFDNVILTPHIAGSTEEAQRNIAAEVAEKLVRYSDNGSTTGAVNFVEVSLPSHVQGVSRFLHIHRNKPGVLEAINNVFSSRKMNITAQYLQTEKDIGYLICDTEGKIDIKIFNELKSVEHTIRARRLV